MNSLPLLSLIVLVPWAGALLLAGLPRLSPKASRLLGIAFSLSTLALGLAAWAGFNPANPEYQFVELHSWIETLNVHYHLGLDGMSLLLILLTGLIGPTALLASWRIERDVRLFNLFFLFLQGAALGVFLSLDFFHWFLFWELSLVPAFFLIRLWGGNGAPEAAYQFVIYTLAGSVFMLAGFAALYVATGELSFVRLAALAADGTLSDQLSSGWSTVVFVGVLLGLAVKVPLFPFHTWLPGAYAAAPTGVSMFLTGVMSKMGVYAFIRILWPIFPSQLQAAAGTLLWLALAGVVLGAFAAMRQTDLKRMIAYSSINHVSYCLLALFAVAGAGHSATPEAVSAALGGTLLQMFNHGLSASALFCCVGIMESRSAGRRSLTDFGGSLVLLRLPAGPPSAALRVLRQTMLRYSSHATTRRTPPADPRR